jgi:lysine 2,3-aminomutase
MNEERRRLPSASPGPNFLAAESDSAVAWTDELRRSITSLAELSDHLELTEDERQGALRAERAGLPIAVTPYYLSLADRRDPRCPIRRQCVPHIAEDREVPGDMIDPLGEKRHEVAPDLVCRYPDRALLLVSDRCSVYCRFCTRSRMVGAGGGARTLEHLSPAFAWLADHPEVRDVIVSGGDPLVMSTERLSRVMARLRAIPSIETIRLATRVPVTLPSRITSELVSALRAYHPIWVMTHFNHPKELTRQAEQACLSLVDAGFPVMNQTVLLRGINDDRDTLEKLFRGLVRWRVRPYYLLQADPVRGTGHLRTPIDAGLRLMDELQGRLSGIALPKLIVDTPGGLGKVPILPDYVVRRSPGRTVLRTFRGAEVEYVDPPSSAWEDRTAPQSSA